MKFATANLMLCALCLTACQSPNIRPAPEFNGDLIAAGKQEIAKAPAQDKNLYRLITALHAFKLGQHKVARELFDEAMPSAGQILKADASTRMAKSLFSPENVKGFHGEPYERAWDGSTAA